MIYSIILYLELFVMHRAVMKSVKKMQAYESARTKLVGGMSLRKMISLVVEFEKNDYTLKVSMKGHHERR